MQTGLINFGVVIEVGMVVIDFVMAYCHFYGRKNVAITATLCHSSIYNMVVK